MFSCPKDLGFIKTVYCPGLCWGGENVAPGEGSSLPLLLLQAFAFSSGGSKVPSLLRPASWGGVDGSRGAGLLGGEAGTWS